MTSYRVTVTKTTGETFHVDFDGQHQALAASLYGCVQHAVDATAARLDRIDGGVTSPVGTWSRMVALPEGWELRPGLNLARSLLVLPRSAARELRRRASKARIAVGASHEAGDGRLAIDVRAQDVPQLLPDMAAAARVRAELEVAGS